MKIEFEELSISEAETFYKVLLEYTKTLEGNELVLDFSEVEKIDLSIIQIFYALKNYTSKLNINLKSINISSTQLQQTIKIYNLENILGIVS